MTMKRAGRLRYPKTKREFYSALRKKVKRWYTLYGSTLSIPIARFIREKHALWWEIKEWRRVGLRRGYRGKGSMSLALAIITKHREDGQYRTMSLRRSRREEQNLGIIAMGLKRWSGTYDQYKRENSECIKKLKRALSVAA